MMAVGKQLEIEREMLLEPCKGLEAPFPSQEDLNQLRHIVYVFLSGRISRAHEVFIALMVFAQELPLCFLKTWETLFCMIFSS